MKTNDISMLIKELRDSKGINKGIGYLGFIISLLPIPGIQQAGKVVDKIESKRSLNWKFEEVKSQIENANTQIANIDDDIEKIKAIADTVNSHEEILKNLQQLISTILTELKQDDSEFIIDTKDWSVQTLVKQIIEADSVSVSAVNNSQNVLRDTKITARKTHLQAYNHSTNIIDGTEFEDHGGSVRMQGISQTGNIQVTGNSIGFGNNGTLIFGNPNMVRGNCPYCNYLIEIDKTRLCGYSSIQCPNCKRALPFKL